MFGCARENLEKVRHPPVASTPNTVRSFPVYNFQPYLNGNDPLTPWHSTNISETNEFGMNLAC